MYDENTTVNDLLNEDALSLKLVKDAVEGARKPVRCIYLPFLFDLIVLISSPLRLLLSWAFGLLAMTIFGIAWVLHRVEDVFYTAYCMMGFDFAPDGSGLKHFAKCWEQVDHVWHLRTSTRTAFLRRFLQGYREVGEQANAIPEHLWPNELK